MAETATQSTLTELCQWYEGSPLRFSKKGLGPLSGALHTQNTIPSLPKMLQFTLSIKITLEKGMETTSH